MGSCAGTVHCIRKTLRMMADQWLGLEPNDSCSGDLERDSCILTESQVRICRGGVGCTGGGGGREGGRDS